MKNVFSIHCITVFIVFSRCENHSLNTLNKKEEFVVCFGQECLTKKEVMSITQNLSKKDSQRVADEYVKEWMITHAMYEEAKKKVLVDEIELNKLLNDFKKHYYVSQYIKNYVDENLDTVVLNKEVLDYYQMHKNSFKLTSNIVQLYYVKLNDDEKEINEFKRRLQNSKNDKDKNRLNNFIIEKAISYFIEDSLWLKWDDVIKEIPALKNYDVNSFARGRVMEWKDGNFYYYIKINDYKVKNEYSPVTYEKEKIKRIILDERRNNLIEMLRHKILVESGYMKSKE